MSDSYEYSPGLAGVPCAKSKVCHLDGQVGKLQYRGYPIEQLATRCTYEEVAHLLLVGHLPSPTELGAFSAELAALRAVPHEALTVLRALPKTAHPMEALAIGVTVLGALDADSVADSVADSAARLAVAKKLVARLPVLVAAWDRIRRGQDPIPPRADLTHAASFLHALSGEEPDVLVGKVFDVALTLHAEHQMNASTFAARVTGSTGASPYATIASAIGALSGPLHGGANEEVLKMLAGVPETGHTAVRAWATDRLDKKAKISGFGHREYKVKDPRASILQALALELFEKFGSTPLYTVATQLETEMAELVGKKGVYPNVDFYSGIVYEKMGIATDLFTPVFAIARVSGWLAHWLEQMEDNRIFRPNQVWTGEADRTVVPLADR